MVPLMKIFFNFYMRKRPSAQMAKRRVRAMVEHDRLQRNGHEYLPVLKQDLAKLVQKHVNVERESMRFHIGRENGVEVLNISIPLTGVSALTPGPDNDNS